MYRYQYIFLLCLLLQVICAVKLQSVRFFSKSYTDIDNTKAVQNAIKGKEAIYARGKRLLQNKQYDKALLEFSEFINFFEEPRETTLPANLKHTHADGLAKRVKCYKVIYCIFNLYLSKSKMNYCL